MNGGEIMILAVDVGNTNITMGIYKDKKLLIKTKLSTDKGKTSDEYAIEIFTVFGVYSIDPGEITGCIIGSVVPQVTPSLKEAMKNLFGCTPLVVGPGIKTGLNIKIDSPETLGADLVVGCAAAAELFPCPCIVICMGTATTICYLDKNKAMCGGAIMPGIGISLNALTSTSALLPEVSLEATKSVIGKNTNECIRSGVVWGTVCMLDGIIEKIEQESGSLCTIVASGDLSPVIVSHCKRDIIIKDDLVLQGLRLIYEKNKNQRDR